MARTKFVLCSAPHGGRFARVDEKTGKPIPEIEHEFHTPTGESKYSEFMPVSVDETSTQMKTLYDLGVRFFHDHAFDASGIHSTSATFYEELEVQLRNIDAQIIHSVASSNRRGAGIAVLHKIVEELEYRGIDPIEINPDEKFFMDIFIRGNLERFKGSMIDIHPDTITTITNLEYSIGSKVDASVKPTTSVDDRPLLTRGQERLFNATHPELIRGYYKAHLENLRYTSVNHEIEVSTLKAFDIIEKHFEPEDSVGENQINTPVHFVILFNFTDGLRLSDRMVIAVLDHIKKFKERHPAHKVAVTFGLVMLPKLAVKKKRTAGEPLETEMKKGKPEYTQLDYRELVRLTVAHDTENLVGCFRVGTEDTSMMYGAQRSDEFFITEMLDVFNEFGLEVETNTLEARKVFNLPPRGDKVQKYQSTSSPNPPDSDSREFTIPFTYDDPDVLRKYEELAGKGYGQLMEVIANPNFEVGEEDFEEFHERTGQAMRTVLAMQPVKA